MKIYKKSSKDPGKRLCKKVARTRQESMQAKWQGTKEQSMQER